MDAFIGKFQALLTLLLVSAWIALLVGGLYLGNDTAREYAGDMKEVVMLAVGFWLLRPRAANGAGKTEEEPKPAPSVAPTV